ncbi:MAG: RNA methyltransferase, partial [Bdellovibrio sp.]
HTAFFFFFAKEHKVFFKEVSLRQLDRLCSGHQGVALLLESHFSFQISDVEMWVQEAQKRKKALFLVALDGVQDPQNLGSIFRSAWLLGAKGLIIPSSKGASLSPTVYKVSSGGTEHVPVLITENLSQVLNHLKELGFWVYGMDPSGSLSLWDMDVAELSVWVLGAEDKGLRPGTKKACDELVFIPQTHKDASFNVSIAAAFCMEKAAMRKL